MTKHRKTSFFWTTYSDLMTSLFFVMLVLFVLTIALLHKRMVATEAQLAKIAEIETAINNIDTNYFEYNEIFKKHILKIEARFGTDQFVKDSIVPQASIKELIKAGKSIRDSIFSISTKYPEIQYLLIIEGQASKDRASDQHNYELSFKRAYTLKQIWDDEQIDFGINCEVLISGSGTGGTLRDTIDELNNQRFIIHIVPKPGIIEASKHKIQ
jgi:hypothetical protein